MLQARDLIEHQIGWKVKEGEVSIWHDNWTGLGDLYSIVEDNWNWESNEWKVADWASNGEWNVQKIKGTLKEDMVDCIVKHIKSPKSSNGLDKPYWMLDSTGVFTVKTAWEYIRNKGEKIKFSNGYGPKEFLLKWHS